MRILILDSGEYYRFLGRQLGKAVVKSEEVILAEQGDYEVYNPTEEKFRWIEAQTKTNFDVIIVGSNNSAGLAKVPHIPVEQRTKVIVVWGAYSEKDTMPYRQLGIVHFATLNNVAEKILEMIS